MSTTHRALVVTNVARIAPLIAEQLLQPRRIYLKHKAPKSRYVHQLRRDIAAQKAKPIDMILSIATADLDDGVPFSIVRQAFDTMLAELEAYAADRRGEPVSYAHLPPLPLVQRETRAQAELDVAQNEFLTQPDSVAVIDRCLDASARYDAEQDRFVNALRARRARLASANTQLVIAR